MKDIFCQVKYVVTSNNHKCPGKGWLMLFREGNIPLYFQFYLKIRNDILLGEIEPGSRLPNIDDLHALYAVSHATVRRALALLEKEGLIIKRRGLGTMVRDQVDLPIWNPSSLHEFTDSAIKLPQMQTLFFDWVAAPRRIRKYFGDQPGVYREGLILRSRRLWVSQNDARQKRCAEVYFSTAVVARIGEEKLKTSSMLQVEAESPTTYRSIKINQTLRPWICDSETAEILGIPDGTPVFHRTWIFLNPSDEVLLVSESVTTANSLVRVMETEVPAQNEI
jgi:GntR family transcriptional regulator